MSFFLAQAENSLKSFAEAQKDPERYNLAFAADRAGQESPMPSGVFTVIDFIVFNQQSAQFLVKGSFEELVYKGTPASDHCPISVEINTPDLSDQQLQPAQMTTALR